MAKSAIPNASFLDKLPGPVFIFSKVAFSVRMHQIELFCDDVMIEPEHGACRTGSLVKHQWPCAFEYQCTQQTCNEFCAALMHLDDFVRGADHQVGQCF